MNNLNCGHLWRLLFYGFFTISFISGTFAQDETKEDDQKIWVDYIKSTSRTNIGHAITKDKEGNIYIAGQLEGTGVFNQERENVLQALQPLTEARVFCFLAKYSSTGERKWEQKFEATSSNTCVPNCQGPVVGFDLTPAGDGVILVGKLKGKVSFGEGATFQNDGDSEGFAIKFKSDGTPETPLTSWTVSIDSYTKGVGEEPAILKVIEDNSGNIFMAGTFIINAIIHDNKFRPFRLHAKGKDPIGDIWVAKFDKSGKLSWDVQFEGTGEDLPRDLAVDRNGNIVIVGSYIGSLNYFRANRVLDGQSEDTEIPLQGTDIDKTAAFIAKLSGEEGNLLQFASLLTDTKINPFLVNIGNGSGNSANSVTTDDDGNIFVTGEFIGKVTAIPNSNELGDIKGKGLKDVFVAKYDPALQIRWFQSYGDEPFETGDVIELDGNSIIVGGRFGQINRGNGESMEIVFGADTDTEMTLKSKGKEDIFIAKFSAENGKFVTANSFGGNHNDRIRDMILSNGSYAFSGDFRSEKVFFSPTDSVENENDRPNVFVASFSQPALIIHVKHQNNKSTEKAKKVELWNLYGTPIIKDIDENGTVVFYPHELVDLEVYDCYLLREDESLIGKINLQYKTKNWIAGRIKEVIITLHNDLRPYQTHPIDVLNEDWIWHKRYKYDYKSPYLGLGLRDLKKLKEFNFSIKEFLRIAKEVNDNPETLPSVDFPNFKILGEPILSFFYPVTLLIPPVNDNANYLNENIDKENQPVIFIPGYTDIDQTWGSEDQHIISLHKAKKTATGMEEEDFIGDYSRTSIPSRFKNITDRIESGPHYDNWEFYYPPEQGLAESGYLLSTAIDYILKEGAYETEKVNLVSYGEGGLVSGAYISGIAKCYKPGTTVPKLITYNKNVDKNLLLASPQQGSFITNRTYWGADSRFGKVGDEFITVLFAGKDPHSPAARDAAIGSSFIEKLYRARLKTPPGTKEWNGLTPDGVTYLCIAGGDDKIDLNFDEKLPKAANEILKLVKLHKKVIKLKELLAQTPTDITSVGSTIERHKSDSEFLEGKIREEIKDNSDPEIGKLLDWLPNINSIDNVFDYIEFYLDKVWDKTLGWMTNYIGKKLGEKFDESELLGTLVLEAHNHSDQNVSISSAGLVAFNIDLGVLGDFGHRSFTKKYHELSLKNRNKVPLIIEEFFAGDGTISSQRNSFLEYIEAGNYTNLDPVLSPEEADNLNDVIRFDITMPFVSFKKKEGNPWQPLRFNGLPGIRFKFTIDQNPLTNPDDLFQSNLAGFFSAYSEPIDNYIEEGMYLYYSGNNFINTEFKTNLAKGGNPNYAPPATFFAYEEPYRKIAAEIFNNEDYWNPFFYHSGNKHRDIHSNGPGWNMVVTTKKRLYLDVFGSYQIPPINALYEKELYPNIVYAKLSTDNNKLALGWSQSTFNEFELNEGIFEIMKSNEYLSNAATDNLDEDSFNGNSNPFGYGAKARSSSELVTWIDEHIPTASFLITWTEGESKPIVTLEKPNGERLTSTDTSSTVFYVEDSGLRIVSFSIINPSTGKWKVLINEQNSLPNTNYSISYPRQVINPLLLELTIDSVNIDTSVFIRAELQDSSISLNNTQLFVYYFNELDSIKEVSMKDDGIFPDLIANDNKFVGALVRTDTLASDIIGLMWGKIGRNNFVRQSVKKLPACDLKADFFPSNLCFGSPTIFKNTSKVAEQIRTVFWELGNDSISNELSPMLTYEAPGSYLVKLKLVTVTGCVSKMEKEITIINPIQPNLLVEVDSCSDGTIQFDAGDGYISYLWSNLKDVSQIFLPDSVDNTNIYSMLTDSMNCLRITDTLQMDYLACPIPQSTTIQNQSDSLLQFSWEQGDYEGDTWETLILPKNEAPGDSGLVVIGTMYEKTGMSSGDYDFYVRSMCGAAIGGCWDGPYEFSVGGNEEFISLAGNVLTEYNAPVNEVSVKWTVLDSTLTNDQGSYDLGAFRSGSHLDIRPFRNTDAKENITTSDLVRIVSHILDQRKLDSPYKIIAADANRSGAVTVTDLVILQAVILGIETTFQNNTTWRFVPKDYDFLNPTNPLEETFPEAINLSNAATTRSNLDFVGIKVGDVTYDLDSLELVKTNSRSSKELLLNIDNQHFTKGEILTIPVYLNEPIAIEGFQMTWSFDTEQFEFLDLFIENKQGSFQYATAQLAKGKLPLIWVNLQKNALVWDNQQPLFTLKLRAKHVGKLENGIHLETSTLKPEMYFSASLSTVLTKPIALQFKNKIKKGTSISIFPNPVDHQLNILGLATDITNKIELLDIYGRSMIVPITSLDKGTAQIELSHLINGTYWLKIEMGEKIFNKKIIKLGRRK